MELEREQKHYRSIVRGYHSLPLIGLLVLMATFFAVSYATGNNVLACFAAAIPSCLLIWRWIHLGQRLDRCVCAKCGQTLPKQMMWKYPPDKCPHCGDPFICRSS
jgi:predicted RNA-binding Zn-ribbon protein involved in translation (DUF1610 family)